MNRCFKYSRFFKGFLLVLLITVMGFTVTACKKNPESNNRTIKVTLDDYSMDVKNADNLTPGPAVIEITNNGDQEHSLVIEGNETMQRLDENIKPGETQIMRVKLEPTSYNVYCPIDDHKNKGMASVIKVNNPEGQNQAASY